MIHDSIPYTKGYNKEAKLKNELEHCATVVYPNYNYEQKLVIAGVYRPPTKTKKEQPSYGEALQQILQINKEQQLTTIVAGDLNINSWKTEFHSWVEENELWELTDPTKPTFKAGTTDDSILMAAGKYIPEGVLPEEEENMKDQDLLEFFPVYVTENRVIGEHMALFLDIGTSRPDIVNDKHK